VTQYPGAIPFGNISVPDRYTVHNLKMDPSGTWVVVITGECTTGTCLAHAWQIGTTTVKVCALACSGHFTETATGWINNSSRPGDVYLQTQMLFRTWANFDTTSNSDLTPLATSRPQLSLQFDSHPSGKNDPLGTHAYPVFNCIYSPVTGIDEPWTSEIIAYPQVPGAVYRFGHSFNSNFESLFQARSALVLPRLREISTHSRATAKDLSGQVSMGDRCVFWVALRRSTTSSTRSMIS
jgi:hypothetical protein